MNRSETPTTRRNGALPPKQPVRPSHTHRQQPGTENDINDVSHSPGRTLSQSGHDINVVIIDDHRMFAESLSRLLADESDIEVVGIAATGSEGLQIVEKLMPDVVLMDYQILRQNGVETAAEIKGRNPTTMIVVLAGAEDDQVILDAIEAGCSGFLSKDNTAAQVVDAVRRVAAGEAVIAQALLARLLPRLKRTQRSIGGDLTEREREILRLLAQGWANKAIAGQLNLSVNTIRNYVQSVLVKLGAHSKLEAVSIAVREGIIDYYDSPGT